MIASIAATQHGLITGPQLHELGLSRSAIAYRVKVGALHRVHPRVFAVGCPPTSREAHWLAAVFAAGEGAALSHAPAARLLGIWRRPEPIPHVVSPRYHRPIPKAVLHQSRTLRSGDVVLVNGIPTTCASRTMLDCGDVMTKWQLAHVLHEAAHWRLLDMRQLRSHMRHSPGRRAASVLKMALDLHLSGSAGTRSSLEDRVLDRLKNRLGMPEPTVNTHVRLAHRSIEVDLYWSDLALVVEVDGGGSHDRPAARAEDARRDAELVESGLRVVRLRPHHLERADSWLARRLSWHM